MQETKPEPLLEKLDVRARTTKEIQQYLIAKKQAAAAMSPDYAALWESIENLINAGGKRLRGYMVYLAYASTQTGKIKDIDWVHAAAAVELLHLALLIHDDIIDRDTLRYGVKNVSGQQYDRYEAVLQDPVETKHFADSAAILAGDLLISGAYELLGRSGQNSTQRTMAHDIMNDAIFRVAGGELLDTESAFAKSPVPPLLIAEEKTASYSFSSPLRIGAALGGGSEETLEKLHQFGISLGVAFQLQDDLLGMFGDTSLTGKSTESDLREGKRTYLVEQFFSLATAAQKTVFEHAFGNQSSTADEQVAAKKALIDSSARIVVEQKITELVRQSQAIVESLNYSKAHAVAYYELIDKCTKRSV